MNEQLFEKDFLLTRVDFDRKNQPRLKLGDMNTSDIFTFIPQFETPITLEIDLGDRYCIGWHDLKTGEDFLCPENSKVDKKYEQCPQCQKRTGFNPAFYNAADGDISKQQIERNSQPHFVYLAYFSDEVVKVGISFAGRGNARLLEQGARAALILGEFSSANVARSYEEKISKMPEFCENVKASAKIKLLEQDFSFDRASNILLAAKTRIEERLKVKFDQNKPMNLDNFYSLESKISSGEIILASDCQQNYNKIIFSGILKAQVGYILLAEQQHEIIAIPLRKFTGYKIKIIPRIIELELPERQACLFNF